MEFNKGDGYYIDVFSESERGEGGQTGLSYEIFVGDFEVFQLEF